MKKPPGRWQLKPALTALYRGDIIAYPTEAVWGLGCDPFNATAVNRLLALKRRPIEKGLILVAADISQIAPLLHGLDHAQIEKVTAANSGCRDAVSNSTKLDARTTTWLIPNHGVIPHWVTGDHDTVAVRISQHPTVKALCLAFGGMIVSTSANSAGCPPALNQLAARRYFRQGVSAYVGGSVGGATLPSSIRHLVSDEVFR